MTYTAAVLWNKKAEENFIDLKYSRVHKWKFDGGIEIKASASPHVVPLPMSDESAVDPEEAFIAAISSCHMLWFLSIAAGKKFIIENYEDYAEGKLEKNEEGKLIFTEVILKPKISFGSNNIPTKEQINEMHHKAHEKCFIANSIKTEIKIIRL